MPTNIFDMQDTWNASGSTFYAIRMNVNNAASAVGSRIMDLLTGGVSQFAVDPTNGVLVGNPVGGLKGVGTVNAQGLYINGVLISGTVKVSGTPTGGQLAQWINGDTLIGVAVTSLGYAPINNPIFTGDPQAPTPPPSDNDTSIATTAFVKTQLAAYQPLDGDLTSLAAQNTNGTWYYRRSPNDWRPVILGDGFVFDNLTGDLETTAPPGMGDVTAVDGPDPDDIAIFVGPTSIKGAKIGTGLSLDTVGTDRVLNATSGGGGGNVNSAGSPSGGQFAQWTDPTHIQGVPPGVMLGLIGGQPAGNYQPLDGDLTSIAGAGLTNSMYYRRLADTWDPVTIGTGLTFASGVLASTGGGGTGTVKYTASTTQPAGAGAGDLWYDLSNGVLSIFVNDGNSLQWVMIAPPGGNSVNAAPLDALAYSGIQINGSMEVSQELGQDNPTTLSPTLDAYAMSLGGGISNIISSQGMDGVPGLPFSHGIQVGTATPVLAAGDFMRLIQRFDGYRVVRLGWGFPGAQPISVGFWIKGHRPGTYTVAVRNGPANRSYVSPYTINAADTWEWKTFTIPGDTVGGFANYLPQLGVSFGFSFCFACGTTQQAPTLNTWLAGTFMGAAGMTNGVAATTDSFRMTGLIVVPGIYLPPVANVPLIMRPFGQELELCEISFQKSYAYATVPGTITLAGYIGASALCLTPTQLTAQGLGIQFRKRMRFQPTVTVYSPSNGSAGNCDVGVTVGTFTVPLIIGIASETGLSGVAVASGLSSLTPGQAAEIRFHYKADARL